MKYLARLYIKKKIRRYLIWIWTEDLEEACNAWDHDKSEDNLNWVMDSYKALGEVCALKTYDQVIRFYRDFLYNQEDRPITVFDELIRILVD